jgi:hypothetical protein
MSRLYIHRWSAESGTGLSKDVPFSFSPFRPFRRSRRLEEGLAGYKFDEFVKFDRENNRQTDLEQ